MNRLRTIGVAAVIWMIFSAQTPYEYFSFRSIVPLSGNAQSSAPSGGGEDIPGAGDIPAAARLEALPLDGDTQRAGALSIVEPFAPPVGIYKRNGVLSKISQLPDGSWQIARDPDVSCDPYRPQTPPPSHSVYRSGLLAGYAEKGDEIPLPSTDPTMIVADFRIAGADQKPLPRNAATLFRCSDDTFAVKMHVSGAYRIGFEVASRRAGDPINPDRFARAARRDADPDAPQFFDQNIRRQLLELFEDTPAYPEKGKTLSDVIRYFQNFKSEPLDRMPENSDRTDSGMNGDQNDLIRRILSQQKGLCRHRVFLFALAAYAWGYRARIVYNEAHAFAEVYVGGAWVPAELGGQAESLRIISSDLKHSESVSWQNEAYRTAPGRDAVGGAVPIIARQSASGASSGAFSSANSDSDVGQNPADGRSGEVLRFDADENFRPQAFRNAEAVWRGRLFRQNGAPHAGKTAILTLRNETGASLRRAFATDSQGFVDARVAIPPDWPLGKSQWTWQTAHE